jgi:hypothetical protein
MVPKVDRGLTKSRSRRRLDDSVKTFIVVQLAAFETPESVVKLVSEEFGISVTRQVVERYHPGRVAGGPLSEKWRVMFDMARQRYLDDTEAVPIAHRAVRLHRLQRLADMAWKKGNAVLEAKIIEQAAKEVGGLLESRRQVEVTGKDGGAVKVEQNKTTSPPELLAQLIAEFDGGRGED